MKKIFLLSFFVFLGFSFVFAQDARVMLQFEDAEKAFNTGNYEEALKHLNEVEKAAGISSKTLYLRIVIENEQFGNGENLYTDKSRFELLQHVRQNAARYLKALSTRGIDDKYREIYRISENLKPFPNNIQEWEKGKQAHLEQIAKQKQQQEEAKKLAIQQQKEDEFNRLLRGQISINQLRYNQAAHIIDDSSSNPAVVYFMRPEEGSKDMVHALLLNGTTVVKKIKTGEYVKLHFTPGLLKIGETTAENRRKVSRGAALLMGGVVGLVATSGKTVAKSAAPFGLSLEAGKTYYVSSIITRHKTILYQRIDETTAQIYLADQKEID